MATGRLFVVATPIGNLGDLSSRAVEILQQVELIACEDTRHTGRLLVHFGIVTRMLSYHEHNEDERAEKLLERLEAGHDIALVSDAGTPLLSDPGYRLVRACREKALKVIPVPGPFAGAAAACVSGLPTDQLLLCGFLPKKRPALVKRLKAVESTSATLVFYLSPHRLEPSLDAIRQHLGDREAFLIREMTKVYETSYSGNLSSILRVLQGNPPPGEYTLVVSGAPPAEESPTVIDVAGVPVRTRPGSRPDCQRSHPPGGQGIESSQAGRLPDLGPGNKE